MARNKSEELNNSSEETRRSSGFKVTPPTIKLSDLAGMLLKYWYWIVLSLLVCGSYAWYLVQQATPLYKQSMSVLLRDDVQGNGTGSTSINLGELGLKQSYTVLEDEMEALRSPDLMEQVIVTLNLTTLYSTPDGLHSTALYGSTLPVRVSFPDMQMDEAASFTLKVDSGNHLQIEELCVNGKYFRVNPETTLEFGDAITTPSGRIIIQKTPFFKENTKYEINVNHLPLATATAKFGSEISVDHSANKRSNVIDIICIDANKDRADDILAALMKCYTQNWIRGKAEVVAATNEFITQRLAMVESELSGVDSNISSYKSSNLIPDVDQSGSIALQESNNKNQQLLDLTNQRQMAVYLKDFISTQDETVPLPVNTGVPGTNIESLIAQYNDLVNRRNIQLKDAGEDHPYLIDLKAEQASLKGTILRSIDNTIVALDRRLGSLERQVETSTARVAANPQQAKYLLSAERQQKVQENLYLYLLQKREENELSQAYVNVNTRVLRQPSGSSAPVSPKPVQTYLIAFAIGLVIPVGGIYLSEISNQTVRGRKDLEGMSVPIVGELPAFKKSSKKKISYFKGEGKERKKSPVLADVVVENGNRNLINEAVRVLRSNIIRMTVDSTPAVIMVTSFNPGSGKTFLTMNLGVSMALKHHKVLLIDGDLRRASLSKFAGNPRKGMADCLSGACKDVDDVIIKDCVVENLDILPVGDIPPNPTELLETKRFTNLIDYLRTEYDYIFIDCPPGEMMADAQIIADVADRTLFVMRVGLFKRMLLQEIERLYEEKKYPNMMIVLNDSVVGPRYGYSYSYGYGYSKKAYKYGKSYYSDDK